MTLQQEANLKSSSLSRKVHKADREKLRRDKLNEQFQELAAVIDPDKPKVDKASILGDSLQAVRDLRNEIKRLRMERGTLFDESRDLKREKCDLEEEKTVLQRQTDELEIQLQQVLKTAMNSSFEVTQPVQTRQPPPPQVQHPYLELMNSSTNPFVYLTTPSIHRVERPCAQYATADSVQDFLSRVQQQQQQQEKQQQQESKQGFQPLAYGSRSRVVQVGDQFQEGCSRSSEEDDNDTQLHLGQTRPTGDDKLVEVDTDLQLKVAASSKTTAGAHAAG